LFDVGLSSWANWGTIAPTGIPPPLDLARRPEEAEKKNEMFQKLLTEKLDQLPKTVTAEIVTNVQINGLQQLSVNAFHEKLDEHLGKRRTIIEEVYKLLHVPRPLRIQ
jgi:hypothetical protein